MRHNILGVQVDVLTKSETIEKVEKDYISKNVPLHLMGVNADKINQCHEDPEMMRIVNSCGIINADGASVVLAGKLLGRPFPERVAGIDLMQELLKVSEIKGYKVYFIGAKEDVLVDMMANFSVSYPKLNIVGSRNGYFSDNEWSEIAHNIKSTEPNIVFVGITSPKKEYLIEYLISKSINSCFMGVGGSFDVLSGHIKRAPKWLQYLNLEWLFRMIMEPKRLFKRYLVGNVTFIIKLLTVKRGWKNENNIDGNWN